MKLILSTYLRTLRERDEFDALLPDLLLCMGIIPISKPQTGTRQFGVDLPAVGIDKDGVEKLFLFVLKQGDIDRRSWSSDGPQAVRPSLEEILDVYLKSHVAPKHFKLPVKIILGTTGSMKEAVVPNWTGFIKDHTDRAEFEFWGADEVAQLIEQHMLNEHLFQDDDRADLRRALALVGEGDYSLVDFHRLLLRQLGLDEGGKSTLAKGDKKTLGKSMVRLNLASRLVGGWSINDGDTKSALIVSERTVLWTWHQLQQSPKAQREKLRVPYEGMLETYFSTARNYVEKIKPYCEVQDALSAYTRESVCTSLSVFEHIGLLASIGLSLVYCDETLGGITSGPDLIEVVDAISGLIENNTISGSPRLDEHSIDISLALILLKLMGREEAAKKWLKQLAIRIDYTYQISRGFPVGTDSLDDLVELDFADPSPERVKEFMNTSWMLATLAGWSAILDDQKSYDLLVRGQKEDGYPDVCSQLWHPVSDLYAHLYFRGARYVSGEAEAPIKFDANIDEYRKKMCEIIRSERHEVVTKSPSFDAGLLGLDFIACRHFRTPVAPSFWYQFLADETGLLPPDKQSAL